MAKLPEQYLHTWKGMAGPGDPLGVPWWVMVVGIGLCASPAYWCTDFLLVQRALAAKDLAASRKTPLVAAIPKMLFPAIVTVQGMLALAVAPSIVKGNYNLALPTLMGRYYHSGMLGLGLTALLASFMSGMAGNITAFNTVFTYDIYQTYFVKNRPDHHYLNVGKVATVVGTCIACASSYIVLYFNNLMDYMQLIGILFISPFFIVFFLGMFWKRPSATAGFYGMVAGLSGATLEVRALPSGRPEVHFSHGFEYLDGRVGTRCRTDRNCGSQLPDRSSPSGKTQGVGLFPGEKGKGPHALV